MEFRERRERAIAVLNRKGLKVAFSEPMFARLMRVMGVEVRPMYFETFWRIVLFNAVPYALLWGSLTYLVQSRFDDTPLFHPFVVAAIAGLLFGLIFACLFAYLRKRHDLPTWESLGTEA